MHGRTLHKTSMLAVGSYRFIRYTSNTGLVAKVEDETGNMQKMSSTHLLPCLSMPTQVQIDELPVYIIDKDAGERSMGESSPIEPC